MASNRYCADYAKRATSACKKCKQKIEKGVLRLGKVVPNPFTDSGGDMKQWFHVSCLFETFTRARATTKKIEQLEDIEDVDNVSEEDKKMLLKHIKEISLTAKTPTKTAKDTPKKNCPPLPPSPPPTAASNTDAVSTSAASGCDVSHRDNLFREFRRLCVRIAEEPSYNSKTKIVSDFFKSGPSGDKFHGDLYLWVKLLLPGFVKRVYNLQSKQLVNHFSHIFGTPLNEMTEHLEMGDVAETVQTFFERSRKCQPSSKSTLSLQQVDAFLEDLTQVTKDDDQIKVLHNIAKKCTANDLKTIIRLIKHDLRINAGAKHILEGVHENAYAAFQTSRNLRDVIDRIVQRKEDQSSGKPSLNKALSVRTSLMTPVQPMLAEACKSVEYAMKKCPNGMYAEIKYDGERVQVHKQGNDFSYFSRSLKPVLPHKVSHFKEYIPKAFPHGRDLILDSEVLLIDTNTGAPLPFGTLGIHKKSAFQDANVCLFVFDCIYYNGENLMDRSLKERRQILQNNMTEVPNRIKFSEMKYITHPDDLKDMIMEVLRKGLEGLVLKDSKGVYEPGKRHWLKVKKDYLSEGVMADSADLVVLGAYYGTGNKGGIMSIFLMGCYDPITQKWCTVTKVHSGHDDRTLDKLQKELDMVKISKDYTKVPDWLSVTKNVVPDFVAKDPKKSQVWEICGAEFSKAEVHTADGISIRFPRVTRIRTDKTWKEATSLDELRDLFEKSKDYSSLPDVLGRSSKSEDSPSKTDVQEKPKKQGKLDFITSKKAKGDADCAPPPSTSKLKRSSDSPSTDLTPKKKAKSEDGKAECMNQPTDDNLPHFLSGCKIYLPTSLEEYKELSRYIIAYDGDVISEVNVSDATHAVVNKKSEVPANVTKSTVVTTTKWLTDCIKLQRILKTAKYKL